MKSRIVEKKQGRVVIRARSDDITAKVFGLAAKLAASDQATLTPHERDLVLVAIAQRLGIDI